MKQIILFVFLAAAINLTANAQRAKFLPGDTVEYLGNKYYAGKEVTLGYGSAADKSFVFIYLGSGLGGYTKVQAGWAKEVIVISKVQQARGKCSAVGTFKENKQVHAMGSKLLIDIEGAIDNKELQTDK